MTLRAETIFRAAQFSRLINIPGVLNLRATCSWGLILDYCVGGWNYNFMTTYRFPFRVGWDGGFELWNTTSPRIRDSALDPYRFVGDRA